MLLYAVKLRALKMLKMLSCLDSMELAESHRLQLDIARTIAAALGRSAMEAAERGYYISQTGTKVDWSSDVQAAISGKISIPPDAPLPANTITPFPETRVQVSNETTLGASKRLVNAGLRPLALNFANGVHPGEGSSAVLELRKRHCAGQVRCITRWLAIRCIRNTG